MIYINNEHLHSNILTLIANHIAKMDLMNACRVAGGGKPMFKTMYHGIKLTPYVSIYYSLKHFTNN